MGKNLRDTQLKGTRALPSGSAQTVDGAAINLEQASDFVTDHEFLVTAPAHAGDGYLRYSIITSPNSNLSGASVVYPDVIEQHDGDAATFRGKLPSTVQQYVGLRIESDASGSNLSANSATLELLL